MKKIFTLFSLLFVGSSLFAQVSNGFYRVKNSDSQRYVYVVDNQGYARLSGAQVETDLDAIYLKKGLENAISDPASVIYVEKHGSGYDFLSQGTSVHEIINYYFSLTSRSGHYSVGATVSGVTAYLSDYNTDKTDNIGVVSTSSSGFRLWDPIEINSSTENYFGVKPSVSCGDKHYSSFYADFGFSPVSADTKVYYVSAVSDYAVLLTEATGVVKANSPVVIECMSENPADNKLDLSTKGSALTENLLKGIYFNTDSKALAGSGHYNKRHYNQTKPTSNTRVLSVNSEGKLVYTTCKSTYLPANSSYLELTSSSAKSELAVCFTKEEFDLYDPNSIDSVEADNKSSEVFDLLGKKVINNGKLPAGIYIIGGKKTVIR